MEKMEAAIKELPLLPSDTSGIEVVYKSRE